MKYASKKELIADIEREHAAFVGLVTSIPRRQWKQPGVWGDDWTVHDLVAHLTEWEQMFLGWHRAGEAGVRPEMPAPGYKWSQTRDLNRTIRKKHAGTSTKKVWESFEASFAETLALARALPEKAIFTRGAYDWTGKNALVTYLGANTASHYRTASKILKRWLKAQSRA